MDQAAFEKLVRNYVRYRLNDEATGECIMVPWWQGETVEHHEARMEEEINRWSHGAYRKDCQWFVDYFFHTP